MRQACSVNKPEDTVVAELFTRYLLELVKLLKKLVGHVHEAEYSLLDLRRKGTPVPLETDGLFPGLFDLGSPPNP